MTWLFILSGAVAVGLLVYLIAALINPENFS
ncbi:MAG: K(+)-transporting ATPase subunit F [Dechloromonas sp.]|jgi:K+-transporting ATPase KdpF subunit|nr:MULTISPECIES: K(+)-transporting ATPase subunit F [Azonexaceae]MBT9522893.1 K(+)-transporting ATPase subunit F [Dechloromonas sp.]UCV17596.1 K(+)-transporting ATPase subunit F [Ferribacterium limneticum]UCV21141.1 K(+)-transporting ATPase subunit F [Ferribacterium limneticum]UCV28027.1 K(+)-transporting ATPase subunit F [Ferribacterium limneticum]UCV31944.1 K(+)-transporting ATPase subunit F [Ferribacterium limneticum]